ncbi:MAG TPA: BatD family protein [Rhodanobacter sp.]|nr:BatD family protein [Rhodanobacter sp.]
MSFRRLIAVWVLAVLLLCPAVAGATDVTATLDRSSVQLGDTVTLNLRVLGAGSNVDMPDLDVLNQDFSILGTSQNSSFSMDNGKASSSLTIGVALRPKHVGTLQIPALSVAGSQTAPLQLQVSAPDPAAAAASHQDVYMEAQVEPDHGYVGQQLSYVLRLFYANQISRGALSAAKVDGVELNQLGTDLNYSTTRGGRTYQVLERRYALIPQHAGHIRIPAATFQGEAIDPNDPNSFFGATSTVTSSSPEVSIDVKAAPADWGSSAWLPARALSLSVDGWPDAQHPLRVGQPLNLSMVVQATGLSYEVLPALSLPTLDGATVYPDKPATGNHQDGQWLVGQRKQAFAIVPDRAGSLIVPAITLKWWNVLSDRMEVAQIPEHELTVLPAIGTTAVQPSTPAAAPAASTIAAAGSSGASSAWRWVALGSLGLWFGSALVWWLWRRRRGSASRPATPAPRMSVRQFQQAFLAAARGSDTATQVRDLLAWARAERPAIQHLGELSAALDDPSQCAAIKALQQRHYAGVATPGADMNLAEVFSNGFVWRGAAQGESGSELPPLYPFKLR